jgi:hypothetical protein
MNGINDLTMKYRVYSLQTTQKTCVDGAPLSEIQIGATSLLFTEFKSFTQNRKVP